MNKEALLTFQNYLPNYLGERGGKNMTRATNETRLLVRLLTAVLDASRNSLRQVFSSKLLPDSIAAQGNMGTGCWVYCVDDARKRA